MTSQSKKCKVYRKGFLEGYRAGFLDGMAAERENLEVMEVERSKEDNTRMHE